jgi:hypothetical protein
VDRHSFDVDPDPTVHSDADPDPDPTTGFIHVGKSEFFRFRFIHSSASLHCFILLISVTGVKIFNIGTVLNFII